MIKLERDRTSIRNGFKGQFRINREKKLVRQHDDGEDFTSDFWKQAKDQLKVESHGKCAYCEGKADHVAHGDVEHFRPKSVYWWLAYCYDNYSYSCQICNQSHKGANFPIDAAPLQEPNVPANPTDAEIEAIAGDLAPDPSDDTDVDDFIAECLLEGAGIIDPYVIDPEPFFSWSADDVLAEVEIRPASNDPTHVAAHAAAEEFLGLNRDELLRWRYAIYDLARTFVTILETPGLPPNVVQMAEDALVDMMDDSAEFAGMVRHLVRVDRGLPL